MAAGLIQQAGGDPKAALARRRAALAKRPKVSGGGAGQLYMAPELARVFDTAEKIAEKAGDKFVTAERLLLALALEKGTDAAKILADAGVTPQASTRPSTTSARAAPPTRASAEQGYDALEALCARPHRGGRRGQARSRHRPRRGDPPHHPGAVAAHQEQSRADRRAGRRQDRHRRRPGASASSRATCPRASRTRSCWRSTWAR